MFNSGDLVVFKDHNLYVLVTPKDSVYNIDFSGILIYIDPAINHGTGILGYNKHWSVETFDKVNTKTTFRLENDKKLSINVRDFVTYKYAGLDLLIAVTKINTPHGTFGGTVLNNTDRFLAGMGLFDISLKLATKVESAMITL